VSPWLTSSGSNTIGSHPQAPTQLHTQASASAHTYTHHHHHHLNQILAYPFVFLLNSLHKCLFAEQIAADMRARNRTLPHHSQPASAAGGESRISSTVPAGGYLGSGAIFESAAAQCGKDVWTIEDDLRSKAAKRAAKQALFAEAFEKSRQQSV
jgi:hypothetical protein